MLKSGPQLGRRTQRRPHASWPRRGERPGCSERERSRSVCRERRRRGNRLPVGTETQRLRPSSDTTSDVCRRCREELERRRAEERARQQAEAQQLIEEKRRREEEEQRRAEEERAQARREAALLQKQVGEEESKAHFRDRNQIKEPSEAPQVSLEVPLFCFPTRLFLASADFLCVCVFL